MPRASRGAGERGLAHVVVDDVKRRILDGELAPGAKLPSEAELIERYRVSRTVVREALQRLQASGLIETFQGRGSFVLNVPAPRVFGEHSPAQTPADVIALMEFRTGVETEAAALAAARASDKDVVELRTSLDAYAHTDEQHAVEADFRFHRSVAAASGNRYFVELLDALGPGMILYHRTQVDQDAYSLADPVHIARVAHEHEAVVEAIGRRDADAARAAMRVHLANSRFRLTPPDG